MEPLKSSLLFIGPKTPLIDELGAEYVEELDNAKERLANNRYAVLIINLSSQLLAEIDSFAEIIQKKNLAAETVLIHDNPSAAQLQHATNSLTPFRLLSKSKNTELQETIQQALERHSLVEQNDQLLELISEQNEKLTKLSHELENRVKKRQKYLENAKVKLQTSNFRVETLHRALVAIHQADSVTDLEGLLIKALSEGFQLKWIRILFKMEEVLEKQQDFSKFEIFSAPLVQGGEMIGQIYFAKDKKENFKKDEHSFLIQVADATSLALDRLNQLENSKTLKKQWEATFDAITAPLALISSDYKVLRCNQAYAKKAAQPITNVIGKTCYSTLFHRKEPCPQCQFNTSFRLAPQKTRENKTVTFEVSTQKLSLPVTQQESFVVLYRDVSDQLKWERQLIESAKMAELGTIGSSIAHELNNPLGGMLSFLQLIKSDLKGDESFYEDIVEMERGGQNCKEIIQNLLSYSRKTSLDQIGETNLSEVVEKAIKLIELQTKSKGIEFKVELPEKTTFVQGQKNLLTQAFRHILQDINVSLSNYLLDHPKHDTFIELLTVNHEDSVAIEIKTALPGKLKKINLDAENDLSLNVTNQIIIEHSGTLEVFAHEENRSLYRVTLPRPET